MKKKLFLIALLALLTVFALSLNAFAYTCEFGDPQSDKHIANWLTAWIDDPANAGAVKAALAEAKSDLTELYGCAEGETYPAQYFESEAQYLNAYCWFAAMDEYYEHEADDNRRMNFEPYGVNPDDINIFINNDFLHFEDVTPIIKDSRTMVPFRLIFNALGMQVDYDTATKKITATNAEKQISFTLGSDILHITENGAAKQVKMDVLPYEENGRTFVPVRFISEAYGWDVFWDKNNKVVIILDKESYIAELNKGFEEINAISADAEMKESFVKALAAYRAPKSENPVKQYAGLMSMQIALDGVNMQANNDVALYLEGTSQLLYDIFMDIAITDDSTILTQTEKSKLYTDFDKGMLYSYSALDSEEAGLEELWIEEPYDASYYDALLLAMEGQTDIGLEMSREIFRINTIGEDIYKTVIGNGGELDVFTFRDLLQEEYDYNFILFNNESISLEGNSIYVNATTENFDKAMASGNYSVAIAMDESLEIVMSIFFTEDESAWGYSMSALFENDTPLMTMGAEYGVEKIEYLMSMADSEMQMEITMSLALEDEISAFPEVFAENAVIIPVE